MEVGDSLSISLFATKKGFFLWYASWIVYAEDLANSFKSE